MTARPYCLRRAPRCSPSDPAWRREHHRPPCARRNSMAARHDPACRAAAEPRHHMGSRDLGRATPGGRLRDAACACAAWRARGFISPRTPPRHSPGQRRAVELPAVGACAAWGRLLLGLRQLDHGDLVRQCHQQVHETADGAARDGAQAPAVAAARTIAHRFYIKHIQGVPLVRGGPGRQSRVRITALNRLFTASATMRTEHCPVPAVPPRVGTRILAQLSLHAVAEAQHSV